MCACTGLKRLSPCTYRAKVPGSNRSDLHCAILAHKIHESKTFIEVMVPIRSATVGQQ